MGACGGEIEGAVAVEVLEASAFFLSPRLKSFLISLEAVMVLAGEEGWSGQRGGIQQLA